MPRKSLDLCFICDEAPCICNAKPAKKAAKPRKRAESSPEVTSVETATPDQAETLTPASTNAVSMREAMKMSVRPDLSPPPLKTSAPAPRQQSPTPSPSITAAVRQDAVTQALSDLDEIRAIAELESLLHPDEKVNLAMELSHPAARAVMWRNNNGRH